MISVVIPLYNKQDNIGATLAGVLSQTYTDFEIVVVDDGSTDNSAEIVSQIDDPRIRLISQKNSGVAAARNKGIEEARGEFVALLDADDLWSPEYLAAQAAMADKYSDCSVFATNYRFVDREGNSRDTVFHRMRLEEVDGDSGILTNYFEVASCSHPPICSSSVMVRRDALLSIGGFPVGIKSGEDLLTWARLACRFKIAYSLVSLSIFNVEGYNFNEKPKRVPAENDFVATELLRLSNEYHTLGINNYISHWHKMRSSIYLRLNMRWRSLREAILGIKYNPLNYKLFAYIVLNFIPSKLRPF